MLTGTPGTFALVSAALTIPKREQKTPTDARACENLITKEPISAQASRDGVVGGCCCSSYWSRQVGLRLQQRGSQVPLPAQPPCETPKCAFAHFPQFGGGFRWVCEGRLLPGQPF